MNVGDALLIGATITSLGACVARFASYRSKDKIMASASVALSLLTFVIITLTIVYLGYLFLSPDYSYHYVWSNSSSDLSTAYKISGIWSGADGSFLLWIWLMAIVLAVEAMLEPRRDRISKEFHGLFQGLMAGILFLFMLILLNMDLFRATSAFQLQVAPDGEGMSILLQTPEMILHPPIVFAGYAFCIAAFSAGAAYLLTKDRNWTMISLPWGRLAWLFLTLGIGIGAIWAYYVLGWGGYWAWDPVETASLLPWLIVSAFLHTQLRHSRKGEYRILSPALGMISLVAVIFATFTTRAGSIWTSSVHAFGAASGTTAGARFSYLLQHDSTVLGIFTLMVLLLAFSIYVSYDQYRRLPKKEEEPEPDKISEYISDKNNMLVTVALFIATSAVMIFLLFRNVNVSQGANMVEFDQKMSLFFVVTMVAMSVCLTWKVLGKQVAFWLGSGMLIVSVLFGVVAAFRSYDWLVAFSIPSYAVAVGASAFKIAKSRVSGSMRKTLQKFSPQLVHLGVALVLLSFVVSTNMQVFPPNLESISGVSGNQVNVGSSITVGDYTISLVDLRIVAASGTSGGMTINEGRAAVFDLSRSGDSLRSGVILTNLYGRDAFGEPHMMKTDVYIYKAVFNDLYLDFAWLDNDTAYVQAKLVPMMNFLWAGFGLLAIGLGVRTVVWRQEPKEVEVIETKPEPAKEQPPQKDYEAMVEEELRKFKEKRSK